jgi:hypothetical protein
VKIVHQVDHYHALHAIPTLIELIIVHPNHASVMQDTMKISQLIVNVKIKLFLLFYLINYLSILNLK